MFAILSISFSSHNVTIFTYYQQVGIKREPYLLLSIHWIQLIEFSLDLSQSPAAFILILMWKRYNLFNPF